MLVDARLRTLSQLSGPTIHELRGAANVLALHLQLLANDSQDDDDAAARRQKSVAAADDGRRRLFDIAETFVRHAGPPDATALEFDLVRVVGDVVALARPYSAHRRSTLVAASGPASAPACGRRDVVTQVLLDVTLALLDRTPVGGTLELGVETDGDHVQAWLRGSASTGAFDPALLARAQSGMQWAGGSLHAGDRVSVRMPVPPGESDES